MADTFIPIATVTVGAGGASTMAFTSIPSTYTDLCLKISARSAYTSLLYENMKLIINSAQGSSKVLYGTGSAAASTSSGGDIQYLYTSSDSTTANTFGSVEVYIPNYGSSTVHSVSVDAAAETNGGSTRMSLVAGLTVTSSAITSISIESNNSSSFVQYSTATLYGIKNS